MSTFLRDAEEKNFDVLVVSNDNMVALSSIYTHVINPFNKYTDVRILSCRASALPQIY